MQGKGARGRKRLVALCWVEGTKLLGGLCCASGWGVLVEGLGVPGERVHVTWRQDERAGYVPGRMCTTGSGASTTGDGRRATRCFVFARRWDGQRKEAEMGW
jgi:hypothetical protein